MKRVAVLISGRGSNMQALVRHARGYQVVLVASDTPEAPGLRWAAEHGIATFSLPAPTVGKTAFEQAVLRELDHRNVQIVALAGYMRLLSPAFLAAVACPVLNIHPSLLPLYKGLNTHARAIAAGDTHAGCSVHRVTEELDGGQVLGQSRVPIAPGDTPDSLAARVLAAEHELYPRVLTELCMTSLERLRAAALALPGTQEGERDGLPTFAVADQPYAQFHARSDGRDEVRICNDGPGETWTAIPLGEDPDWTWIEDQVARSWELSAPAALLEAGGR